MLSQSVTMLSFVVIILAIFGGIQDVDAKPPRKIVNGHTASIDQFPSTVSIRVGGQHLCGGTLISNKHVLSAAHCVAVQRPSQPRYDYIREASEHVIYTGSSSSSSRYNGHVAEKVHVYPSYTGGNSYKDDIVIFTLKDPIVPNKYQKPISLPSRNVVSGETGDVVGWGYLSETLTSVTEILRSVGVYVVDSKECQKHVDMKIYDTHVCGLSNDGTGFCSGDSGGPLIIDNEIVGIVSFSWYCGDSLPDVYTNVYKYRDWISEIVASEQ